jgi:hypothetical protein
MSADPREPKGAPLSWTEERGMSDFLRAKGRAPVLGLRREGARDERPSDEGEDRGPERPEPSGTSRVRRGKDRGPERPEASGGGRA